MEEFVIYLVGMAIAFFTICVLFREYFKLEKLYTAAVESADKELFDSYLSEQKLILKKIKKLNKSHNKMELDFNAGATAREMAAIRRSNELMKALRHAMGEIEKLNSRIKVMSKVIKLQDNE